MRIEPAERHLQVNASPAHITQHHTPGFPRPGYPLPNVPHNHQPESNRHFQPQGNHWQQQPVNYAYGPGKVIFQPNAANPFQPGPTQPIVQNNTNYYYPHQAPMGNPYYYYPYQGHQPVAPVQININTGGGMPGATAQCHQHNQPQNRDPPADNRHHQGGRAPSRQPAVYQNHPVQSSVQSRGAADQYAEAPPPYPGIEESLNSSQPQPSGRSSRPVYYPDIHYWVVQSSIG